MEPMYVIAVGSEVRIGPEWAVWGTVVMIQISGDGLTYKVAWWDKNTRYEQWVIPQEIQIHTEESPYRKIGFLGASDGI